METMNNYGIIIGNIKDKTLYKAVMESIENTKKEQYQETETGK